MNGNSVSKIFAGGTLVNNGAATWTNGQVAFNGGTFSNTASATLDLLGDGSALAQNTGTPVLANDGALRKIVGTGTTTVSVSCRNSGTIQANTGTLSFGPFTQNDGQTLLNGGNLAFSPTTQ